MGDTNARFANGNFCFCGSDPVSPGTLGRDIAATLFNGHRFVDSFYRVDPDTALDMLRHTGRAGKLYSSVQTDDYPFGYNTGEAYRLREEAAKLSAIIGELRDSEAMSARSDDLGNATTLEALKVSRDKILTHVGSLYAHAGGGHTLAHRYSIPRLKRSGRFPSHRIAYNAKGRAWNFGGYQVGLNKLGRIMALTLLSGYELVRMGEITVSVNYLAHMLQLSGAHGRFVDFVDEAFNPYAPAGSTRQGNSRL